MTLKRLLLLLVSLLFAVSAWPRSLAEASRELEEMLDVNQAASAEIENALQVFGEESGEPEALRLRMKAINKQYFFRVEEIVKAYGWPQETQVGAAAAKGALLVVLSADASDHNESCRCLLSRLNYLS